VLAVDVGPVLLVLAVLVALPAILLGGMAVAAIVGWALKLRGEDTHPGSELIELNR
jgi:hypothetical protein